VSDETGTGGSLSRGQALGAIAAGSLLGGAGALAVGLGIKAPERARAGAALRVPYRRGRIPEDVRADAWVDAPPILVALQPQQAVPPVLAQGDIDELKVRALHNGKELAFRLEWRDARLDETERIGRFRDAVAVQLPAADPATPPSVMMGSAGKPVHVLQWRASWQRDLGDRFGVEDAYPNIIRDVSPDDLLGAEAAAPYTAARAAGNLLAAAERTTSVEELVAEGFGTLTPLARQRAWGAGAHDDGRWRVTIALPLARDEGGSAIEPGSTWPAAFAVWLGGRGNRGGRKHFSNWIQCTLEGWA
jgi:hypothetical protein